MYALDMKNYNIQTHKKSYDLTESSFEMYPEEILNMKRTALLRKEEINKIHKNIDDELINWKPPIFDIPLVYGYTNAVFEASAKWHQKYLWITSITDRIYQVMRKIYNMNENKRPAYPSSYVQHNFTDTKWPEWVYKYVYFRIFCCQNEIDGLKKNISSLEKFEKKLRYDKHQIAKKLRRLIIPDTIVVRNTPQSVKIRKM